MKPNEIKFKATNLLTMKEYHFTLNDIGIEGNIQEGGYAVLETKEGKNIPCYDLENEYDIEIIGVEE